MRRNHAFPLAFLAILLLAQPVRSNQYDTDEQIRRDAQRLSDYEAGQREAAKNRYDEAHHSSGGSGGAGLVFLALVIGFAILKSRSRS